MIPVAQVLRLTYPDDVRYARTQRYVWIIVGQGEKFTPSIDCLLRVYFGRL